MTAITVDVGRLLTDVGSSLYKSGGTILDELVQNAQRAKAKNLEITLVQGYSDGDISVLEIRDDGKGLKKAQDLLKLASSGWDKGVVASDQPFGMGFWSTVTATCRVEVRSNNLEIVIDANLLHRTKSVKDVVTINTDAEHYPGFRVRLFSVPRDQSDNGENRRWKAWKDLVTAVNEMGMLLRFTEFESVLLRNDATYGSGNIEDANYQLLRLLEKAPTRLKTAEPLSALPSNISFSKRVENEFYEGVLWPQTSSWTTSVNAPVRGMCFYAQKRIVQHQDYSSVGGWVHLKPGAVNLRAPDRKDFIEDDKHRAVMDRYKDDERSLFIEMAMTATDAELESFDGSMRYILKDEDVLDLIPYLFGKGTPLPGKGSQTESKGGELKSVLPRKVNPNVEWAKDESFAGDVTVQDDTPQPERVKRQAFEMVLPAVWVEASEEAKYETLIAVAKDAGLPVIVGSSAMQKRALLLKSSKDARLMHVRDLNGKISVEADVKAPKIKLHEGKYLLPALEKLAQAVGAEKVKIGYLTHRKVLTIGTKKIPVPVKDGTIILGMNAGNNIYVDASYAMGVAKEAEGRHAPTRYIFFRLLSTVAHERAHQLTPAPDGTPEHLQMIEDTLHSANDWIAENL
jgi:hypothetical protein